MAVGRLVVGHMAVERLAVEHMVVEHMVVGHMVVGHMVVEHMVVEHIVVEEKSLALLIALDMGHNLLDIEHFDYFDCNPCFLYDIFLKFILYFFII